MLNIYWAYKDDLIPKDVFDKAVEKLKAMGNSNHIGSHTDITQGQINYIKKLQADGKIPHNQTLNISKDEARILIHNALEKKSEPEKDKVSDTELDKLYEENDY
jgi:hypothetical protein